MFEFLKKKISDFTGKIKEKLAGKESLKKEPAEDAPPKEQEPIKEEAVFEEEKPVVQEAPLEEEKKKPLAEGPKKEKPEGEAKFSPSFLQSKKAAEKIKEIPKQEPKKEKEKEKEKPSQKPAEISKEPEKEIEIPEAYEAHEEHEAELPKATVAEPKPRKEGKHELKAKVSLATKLKGLIKSTITISDDDLESLLSELELSLLESDVEQDAASEIVSSLRKELSGKEIEKSRDISEILKEEIRKSLRRVMDVKYIDLFSEAEKKKPLVILFLGPNGAGKTTTIAKLTSLFSKKGKKVLWAAADTFRAASIEQLEEHARLLNVKVVKHKYGSDPAAVAFDAIESAKAHSIDVVMIDSAGRQETNKNLMEELRKIVRVAKPDFKVYVGESYSGQSLLNQASEFDKSLGIDGFILTKVDADAKGGTAISLLYCLKKPILFIGTGQEYDKLIPFEPNFIIDRIV